MGDDLKISTLNVNGLADPKKRRDVFSYLREQNHDVYFLQETHIKENLENCIRSIWGYELWIAGNSTNKNGVAVLFNSTFEHKVHNIRRDPNGCFIIVDAEIRSKRVTLANIYGPSAGDNETFFVDVFNLVSQIGNELVIMGGDWNCILNPMLDSRNYAHNNPRPRTRTAILNSMAELDLVDVFRKLYPERRAFSWRRFNSTKQGRLDYFLISHDLLGEVKKAQINPGYRTDHSLVTISIRKNEFKRDRPFWKFNNSLLKDKLYVNSIKETIDRVKKQYAILIYSPDEISNISARDIQFSITDQLFFETLLFEIRGKTISYASYKKKAENEKETTLNDTLKRLENNNQISEEEVAELEGIKAELEQLRQKKIEGIAVRCRATWMNEGEKPTRYFCNLENRHYTNKSVSFLEKSNGDIIDDQTEILREVEHFYRSLYSKRVVQDVNISTLINNAPKLTEIDINLLLEPLTFPEIAAALKSMKNFKSPGPDGFTVEFFKFFFVDIGDYYARSIYEGLANGKLSVTQYQGIITCIPKGDKPKQFIKNWRPISLLNVTYKILSTCIAARIQRVLPSIIHHSQKGFIKGRYIGDNIRTLYDILAYTKAEDLPGLIIAIDFEKAFDSVSWAFIEKALVFFGFPENIVLWFKTLYRSPNTCITFNGQYSNWFPLGRGCRQGDSISPYLYLICAEIMSLMFRSKENLKGISIRDQETLLNLFADDTTLFLDGSEESFDSAFEVLDSFSAMSGLQINNEKTKIVWIGSRIGCNVRYMRDRNFIWDPGTFDILGITFSVKMEEIVNLNFKDKIDEVKRDIAKWNKRNLTPFGKITLIKALIMSKLTYLFINLPDPPVKLLDEIDTILNRFLWGGKTNRIKKSTTFKNYQEGGLKMYNIYSSLATFKLSWLRRVEKYVEEECLSLRMYPELKNINKFGNAYPEIIRNKIKNYFWFDVLKYLDKLMKTQVKINKVNYDVINEPLHFNNNIKRGNKTISITEWIENNIVCIRDIIAEDGQTVIDFETFKAKYVNTPRTNFLDFNGIALSVRQFLTKSKNNPSQFIDCSFLAWDMIREGNSKVRDFLHVDDKQPTATLKWDSYFPALNWNKIFKKCHKITIDTQLRWFQLRILHRILPTRRYLHICKIIDSPICLLCKNHDETLCHLFWECTIVQTFWKDLETLLRLKCYNCSRFSFKLDLVIFGTSEGVITDTVIDFIILYAKFHIYKCRFNDNTPNLLSFIRELKTRIEIDKLTATRRNKHDQFQLMWFPYIELFKSLNES